MIKPTQNFLLVEPDKKEEVTAGGIYLPEKMNDTPQEGKVIDGVGFKKGTRIWFKMWAGEKITYNETQYLLINLKDIIAYENKGVK